MAEEHIPRGVEKRLNAWREEREMCSLQEERENRHEFVKRPKSDVSLGHYKFRLF
jgi:hypothetical protein